MTKHRVLRALVPAGLAIAILAGCGGGDDGGSAYKEPTGPAVKTLSFKSGNLFFDPKTATSPAGIIDIKLKNEESIHSFRIKGVPGFELTVSGSGATAEGKVDLKPGKYEYYCAEPGHEEAGMKGELTVK
jgi:plastocyanin